MKKMLAVFLAKGGEAGAEKHKLNRIEKVTLAAPVPAHNHIMLRTKWLDLLLTPK